MVADWERGDLRWGGWNMGWVWWICLRVDVMLVVLIEDIRIEGEV